MAAILKFCKRHPYNGYQACGLRQPAKKTNKQKDLRPFLHAMIKPMPEPFCPQFGAGQGVCVDVSILF
ncbi:hypothetical protein [Marinicella meishanensis]|uniref:hypothetical protein n=1 Tax=Marinicella meishanensis TaxID=2873263 RepID=UPI001CBF6F2A|nr:hypothetical protein [Marinicella sp. NBU2979]